MSHTINLMKRGFGQKCSQKSGDSMRTTLIGARVVGSIQRRNFLNRKVGTGYFFKTS